jgi:hypothetical protein
MLLRRCILMFVISVSAPVADTAAQPVEAPPTLAAIDVAGVVPGPGLWQVRRGEHVLWLVAR